MSDLNDSRSAEGGAHEEEAGRPGGGLTPFFPGPPGRHATPPSGVPLSGGPQPMSAPTVAPPPAPPPPPPSGDRAEGGPGEKARPETTAVVKGQITIGDEVFEKVAALAAMEVPGVAALSERGEPVRVQTRGEEAKVDLTVVVEYGCVVMDVARQLKTNVARVIGRMLGMRVSAVNVVVDDVLPPGVSRTRAPRG